MITKERLEEIERCWNTETNDEESQEWRDDLTEEEEAFVDNLDNEYTEGIQRIYAKIGELLDH